MGKLSRKEEKLLMVKEFRESHIFDKQTFAKNLKTILSVNKIPQRVLADCIGTSSQTINNWIGGDNAKVLLPREMELIYNLFAFLFRYIKDFNLEMLLDNN